MKSSEFFEKPIGALNFEIEFKASFGQAVFLSGNRPETGSWNPLKAKRLSCTHGKTWQATIRFELDQKKTLEELHYKFFVSDFEMSPESPVFWEPGFNRVVRLEKPLSSSLSSAKTSSEKSQIVNHWGFREVSITLNYPINFLEYEMHIQILENNNSEGTNGQLDNVPNAESLQRMFPVFSNDANFDFSGKWRYKFLIDCSNNLEFEYTYALVEKKTQSLRWERNSWRQFKFAQITMVEQDKSETVELYPAERPLLPGQTYDQVKSEYEIKSRGRYNKHDLSVFRSEFIFHKILPLYYIGPLIMSKEEVNCLKQQEIKAILNLNSEENMEKIQFNEAALLSDCEKVKIAVFNFPIDESGFQDSIKPLTKFIKYITKQHGRVYIQSSLRLSMAIAVSVNFLLFEENQVLKSIFDLFHNVVHKEEMTAIVNGAWSRAPEEKRDYQ